MSEKKIEEMGAGGVAGFQLPLGAKERKSSMDECIRRAGDVREGHLFAFLRGSERIAEFYDALDLKQYNEAANLVREHLIREAVRTKIREVVRKKAGGGGYVLYAPNKGKKHPSHPVGAFPTKLAAKRAELARFPPKDPKKLQRLRKEISRLMKDPKKRAEAEKRALKTPGTDVPGPKLGAKPVAKHEGYSRELAEAAVLSAIIARDVKRNLTEGLFKEEAPASEWDEYINKISDRALTGDKGYQRIHGRMAKATAAALGQAVRIIQKTLGGEARVKAAKAPGTTDKGQTYIPFHIEVEAASVGPIFLYVQNGRPAIEMSDEAKNGLTKVTPGAAKAIRAALAGAQDSLEKIDTVQSVVGDRDAYLARLESSVDKMLAGMSPLQISMLKQLLVKKYRSMAK